MSDMACTHNWAVQRMELKDHIGVYRIRKCSLCGAEVKVYPYLLNDIFSISGRKD